MEFAPSTYYTAKSLKRQDKDLTHDDLKLKVKQVFKERFTLLRENFTLSYLVTFSSRTNQVAILMKELGLKGISIPKKKKVVTTVSNPNDGY